MTENETMTPAPNGGAAACRAPRWMKILLGVSLAMNVLVLAGAAGIAIRHGPRGESGFREMRYLERMMPEDRRDEARAIIDAHREEMRASFDRQHEARTRAGEAFKADPYASEAVAQALDELSAANAETRAIAHRAMVELGARLSAGERAEIVERFQERGRRWRERRGYHRSE